MTKFIEIQAKYYAMLALTKEESKTSLYNLEENYDCKKALLKENQQEELRKLLQKHKAELLSLEEEKTSSIEKENLETFAKLAHIEATFENERLRMLNLLDSEIVVGTEISFEDKEFITKIIK